MQLLKRICREWIVIIAALVSAAFMVGDSSAWIEYISGYKPKQEWVYIGVFIVFTIIVIARLVKLQSTIDEIKGNVRFDASPSWLRQDLPPEDEQPLASDEFYIHTNIGFEIWTDIDIATATLVLNIVGVRNLHWWEFWKFPRKKRLIGIQVEGQENAIYRQKISHSDNQPFKDSATFKWRGKNKLVNWGEYFLLELALKGGIPNTVWRTYIDPKLYERGLTKPL